MWRYRFVLLVFSFLFLLVIARLFFWQVIKAEELSSLASAQYGQLQTIFPKRGDIKTADGFSIATTKVSYTAFANPKAVPLKKREEVVQRVSSLLAMPVASVAAVLSQDLFWVPIRANVNEEEKQALEKASIPGIGFEQRFVRLYPEASMAAHLLGFVGKNKNGEDKGYFGLEGYYDRQLRGKVGRGIKIRDALGRPVVARMSERFDVADGRSLVLSIDRAIQFLLEKKLRLGIEKYQAVSGMVVVLDPKTGNILAMAVSPSFDPTTYHRYEEAVFKNPIISSTFEPGSTVKSAIMAAALDANVVSPETICTACDGPVTIADYSIRTWNEKYYPQSTMVEVIQHSDNTGMVFVARKLGLDRMLSYFTKFGIGEQTNIDLQGEVSLPLRARNAWYPIDLATVGFGQGISLTPMQLLTAFSAIANEGKRMEPHVVSQIETEDGKRVNIAPKVVGRPISPQTAKVITEILINAVNKGEAQWTRLKGYRIAGKTGTAQIPIAGHYDPDKTITSFIGFAPADDPKFSMLVVLDRPTVRIFGAETAAPIFFDIAKDILAYYNIAPTE